MMRSFIKNVKERKECHVQERKERFVPFIKNAKVRKNARSFEKNGCPTLRTVQLYKSNPKYLL